jgi:hypothetical protein
MSASSQESVVTVVSLGGGGERLMYVVLGLIAQTFFFGKSGSPCSYYN